MSQNLQDYELAVAKSLEQAGWTVTLEAENSAYTFAAVKDKVKTAVKVYHWQPVVGIARIEQFKDFLDHNKSGFKQGYIVAANKATIAEAFSSEAIELAKKSQKKSFLSFHFKPFYLATPEELPPPPHRSLQFDEPPNIAVDTRHPGRGKKIYIGVFTSKGGVGKTTVSAHLAGAFALSGYNVDLIDIDPQQNLKILLSQGIFLKDGRATINVFSEPEFVEAHSDAEITIVDCSPDFDSNPPRMIKKFDYCLIPTTLSPLGINKNGHVITTTVEKIRSVNPDASLMVLINNYHADKTQMVGALKEKYQAIFAKLAARDAKFQFIDPDQCVIHFDKRLFYWGHQHFINEQDRVELAFSSMKERNEPRDNFLALVNYLEKNTGTQPATESVHH